jgi:hypothetical protein
MWLWPPILQFRVVLIEDPDPMWLWPPILQFRVVLIEDPSCCSFSVTNVVMNLPGLPSCTELHGYLSALCTHRTGEWALRGVIPTLLISLYQRMGVPIRTSRRTACTCTYTSPLLSDLQYLELWHCMSFSKSNFLVLFSSCATSMLSEVCFNNPSNAC